MAALEVIIPDDAGGLWEALKESGEVDSALDVLSEPHPADDKYLMSLAEAYQHASSWDTRRKVLSVMAGLVPYSLIQRYLPGITEYRVKTLREHGKKIWARLCYAPVQESSHACKLCSTGPLPRIYHQSTRSYRPAFWPKATFLS